MKRIIGSILISSLLITGCSHNLSKYSNEQESEFYDRINKLCENKDDLILEVTGGQKYSIKKLIMSADSTKFIDIKSNMTTIISTNEIITLSFTDSSKGAFDGFLSGLWIGSGTGLLAGQLISSGSSGGIGRLYLLIYSVLAGVVIGSAYGLLNPGTTIIKIN